MHGMPNSGHYAPLALLPPGAGFFVWRAVEYMPGMQWAWTTLGVGVLAGLATTTVWARRVRTSAAAPLTTGPGESGLEQGRGPYDHRQGDGEEQAGGEMEEHRRAVCVAEAEQLRQAAVVRRYTASTPDMTKPADDPAGFPIRGMATLTPAPRPGPPGAAG